jgi:hypothetical protein
MARLRRRNPLPFDAGTCAQSRPTAAYARTNAATSKIKGAVAVTSDSNFVWSMKRIQHQRA